jgi:hypothetical protein
MFPAFRHSNADGGQTRVWLKGQGQSLHGGFQTLNTSAWPNDASVCLLSSVLETGPIPPRYYLSPAACAGILRRAEKRGKTLPRPLLIALQSAANKFQK